MTATDIIPTATEPVTRGHNNPPSLLDADGLKSKFGNATEPGVYTELDIAVTELLANVRATTPHTVETDHDNGIIAKHMVELRTTIKTVLNHHEAEKAEYLRAGRFCDQHFFAFRDRLVKASTILQAKGDNYTARKAAEARAERAREAAAAAKAAEDTRIEAARIAQERADAEAAAARARKSENIAAHEAKAETLAGAEAIAQVDAMIAESTAENTMLASLAPTADLVRTRHEAGHLSTGQQVGYVQIVDGDLLDRAALWAFISDDEKLKALKVWAKIHKHRKPMDGAIIEMRDKARY